MKAIILAAGSGTRLLPYTEMRPKCLVEIAGQSLLDRQITVMRSQGIDDITVITGYLAEKIERSGISKLVAPNYERTNMVATLFLAAEIMNSGDDVIVSYGDIVYDERVLARLLDCEAPICLPVDVEWKRFWSARMPDPLADAETLKIDGSGNVVELGKKPLDYSEIEAQYIGLIKFNAAMAGQLVGIYDGMDRKGEFGGKDFDNMYMTTFLQILIDSGVQAKAVKIENGWLEVDAPEDLEMYNDMYAKGTLSQFIELV